MRELRIILEQTINTPSNSPFSRFCVVITLTPDLLESIENNGKFI